jgi:hypothetical protein
VLPIYLLTDFGVSDECAAALKGVIRSFSPAAEIMDISHNIPPFDVCKGAVVLAAAVPYLPPGVYLAVVDPGVGTGRRAVLLECGRGDLLLGPDNGLLIPAAERLGGASAAWSVEREELFLTPVHPTFHGRDVFAPVAARLAGGLAPGEAGPAVEVSSLVPAPWKEAVEGPGVVYCQVIDADRFGNLRLNAGAEMIEKIASPGKDVQVDLGEVIYDAVVADTYGRVEPGGIILYADSSGWLGLAMREGDLAAFTGARSLQSATLYLGSGPKVS